jgi:site-specific recombinase XerD
MCASSFAGSPLARASGAASLRTSCATPTPVELAREGVPLNVIQRQLGHANLGTTSEQDLEQESRTWSDPLL